ncbi:hypothetical protein [Myxosarcina sp. GI1(2024)]
MEVDLIPLSQLPSRYGIARSNLYNRLKDLKIESVKQGRKAFITSAQLQLLDGLHAHLKRGGTTNEFLELRDSNSHLITTTTTELSEDNPRDTAYKDEPTISLQPSVLVNVIEAVVKRLVPSNCSRLNYLRELEEAYEKGWLLSTKEVAELLGLNQKTITNYGEEFTDAGFIFARAGTRKGGEIAWSIDKETSWTEANYLSTKGVKQAFSDAYDP